MLRLLIFLIGMLSTSRTGGRAPSRRDASYGRDAPPRELDEDDTWYLPPEALPPQRPYRQAGGPATRPFPSQGGRRHRRVPLKYKLAALLVLAGLIFRINVHLPHIRFGWPWQSVTAGTTTDIDVGPWVLQKIEGISKPALGTENFNFTFTHKVSKSIGIWPCWYSSTFAAVGRASATVDLNPGPAWWTPGSGHYRLQVLSRPVTGSPGRVSVTIVLPQPQLPQSVHDVTVDNTLSHPIDVQHSWTYPGLGCGALIRPQFSEAVLYSQAQNLAFSQVRTNPQITRPLIDTAEAQAAQIIRNNFVQPTVNALGYTLTGFTIRWSAAS